MMATDSNVASLADKLCGVGMSSVSGLQDRDYPSSAASGVESTALKQYTRVKRVPLPAELVEHFGHMQCNCSMGIFPQVSRAWLTIDSDIYLWRYEDGGDLAFFDGLGDTILNVSLVTPKQGILQSHIKYLLCLATPVEIVLLGVSFTTPQGGPTEELHLLPEPLFSLPCEQLVTKSLQGTAKGRIFMGGKDGCLYEFGYQSQEGWFGKKTNKLNHSSGAMSWVMSSLLGLAEEDPILQIVVDDSRNILYTRSEKGTLTLYDLGSNGEGLEKVVSVSAQKLLEDSSRLAATVETNNLKPIINISSVGSEEDDHIHLIALTGGGSRLYLSTRNPNENNPNARPYCLKLLHVRLPPGFAPSAPPQKPTKVHSGYYKSGLTLLSSSPAEAADVLWLIWNGCLPPGGNTLMESHSVVPVEGHTWAIDEVSSDSRLINLYRNSYNGREPPSAVIQHCSSSRQIVVLSAQGALLISALRPVDCLRQLLIECGGPDAEAVKLYFGLQGAEQATATALILATSLAIVDRQVADWSARALLLYGGEPKLVFANAHHSHAHHHHQGFPSGPQQQGFSMQPGFTSPTSATTSGFLSSGNTSGYAGLYQSPAQYQISSPGGYVSSPPQTTFHPNLMSTPAPGGSNSAVGSGYGGYPSAAAQAMQQQQQQMHGGGGGGASLVGSGAPGAYHPLPELQFSPRHNGLYLFISRLLRPIWTQPLLISTPSGGSDTLAKSVVSGAELEFLIAQLHGVRLFMERNSNLGFGADHLLQQHLQQQQQQQQQQHLHAQHQHLLHHLPGAAPVSAAGEQQKQLTSQLQQQRGHQDALLREKQSLLLLRQLLVHSLQVLGLWMVVVDHQVDLVINFLSNDNKNLLKQLLLRDIVVSGTGREICSSLVECLIQRYLGDSATTDAISTKLREVCPGLYRAEDAASSKAHELLLAAAQTNKAAERDKMVKDAVTIAKQIAGSLRLEVLVSHLTTVHAYTSVVEICLAAAAKKDPQGLAVHYYTRGDNCDDTTGLAAYNARTDCYRHCINMLKTLLSSSSIVATSPSVPKSPGPPPAADPTHLAPAQASEWAEEVFRMMVNSEDEILHASLYQWLIDNQHTDRLLGIQSPYLENYLKRGIAQHPDQLALFDIIWKYYERNGQYFLAAKILDKLSSRHSTELNLHSRVEYLSRAILCVRSGESGANSRGAGELLHHLEEKMEVARVHLMVLEAASNIPAAAGSISRLNSDLLDITTLYQDWAEPYQLWEGKLAILATAGHPDPLLIQTIWTNIIDRELERLENTDMQTKKLAISGKIESLGRLYMTSSKYFPLEFLVNKLELISCKEGGGDYIWVPTCLQKIGVDLPRLLDVYNRIYLTKEAVWLTAGDELHILRVLSSILTIFVESPSIVASTDRRQFTVVCQDAVSAYLGELYMKQSQDTATMVNRFRDIQSRLDRL